MKRNRQKDVEMLIERHKELSELHAKSHHFHNNRVKELEDYLYELRRPGFKTKHWKRYTGKSSRVEPYLITQNEATVGG